MPSCGQRSVRCGELFLNFALSFVSAVPAVDDRTFSSSSMSRGSTRRMVWLNNGRLLFIVLVPFATGLMTEYSESASRVASPMPVDVLRRDPVRLAAVDMGGAPPRSRCCPASPSMRLAPTAAASLERRFGHLRAVVGRTLAAGSVRRRSCSSCSTAAARRARCSGKGELTQADACAHCAIRMSFSRSDSVSACRLGPRSRGAAASASSSPDRPDGSQSAAIVAASEHGRAREHGGACGVDVPVGVQLAAGARRRSRSARRCRGRRRSRGRSS